MTGMVDTESKEQQLTPGAKCKHDQDRACASNIIQHMLAHCVNLHVKHCDKSEGSVAYV